MSASGLGSFLGSIGNLGGKFEQPQVIHRVIAADDFEVAVLLLAIFARLGVGAGGREGDGAAVGRPGDRADAVLFGGQLRGLAAGGRDQVDLALAVAVGDEREAARIGRPLRAAGDFLPLVSWYRSPVDGMAIQICVYEIVLVPVGLLHGVRDEAAVGRDLRAGHGLHAERFLDGGNCGAGRAGGGAKQESDGELQAHC